MILQYCIVGLLVVGGAIIQSSLLGFMSDLIYFDLVFVMVMIIGLYKDPVHGSIMAVAAGYVQDLLVSDLPGFYMTGRLVVFFMAQYARGRFTPETPLSQFLIGFIIGLLDRLVIIFLHQAFMDPLTFSSHNLALMLAGSLLNAALVPLFYFLFRYIPGFMEVRGGPRLPA